MVQGITNHAEDYEFLKSSLVYQNISDNETYEISKECSRKQDNSVDCGVFTVEGNVLCAHTKISDLRQEKVDFAFFFSFIRYLVFANFAG
mmetsp:Transcript_4142/g.5082  ORF Transcript_4142/g.5082 Transcript_4142/m.5082 type:complete len:90 (+) Transcript_4142:1771-2040(+)